MSQVPLYKPRDSRAETRHTPEPSTRNAREGREEEEEEEEEKENERPSALACASADGE